MHFFTEPDKIISQENSFSYGPISGEGQTKFATGTSIKVSTVAKVFACQESMMIVQPHKKSDGTVHPDLINIILKPVSGLGIPFSTIKYYVYRGVSKNSMISGTAIAPSNTSSTEFITKFWQRWNQFKTDTSQPGLPDPTPQSFGFDDTLPETILLEEIYNSEASSNTEINDLQAIKVLEGEWIANIPIDTEFNFEVIIDTDHLILDLVYVRKFKNIVDTLGLGNGTPQEKFILKAEREKILNYIDPVALYGMFYNVGVKISTYTGTTKNTVTKTTSELYTEILDKFITKNRVYLDVRSERGYNYNYYENYGDENGIVLKQHRKFGGTSVFENLQYTNWPILWLVPFLGITDDATYNYIELQLRVDDNLKPLLFVENPKLLGDNNIENFVKETDLLDGTNTEWTKKVKVQYPNYNTTGAANGTKLDVAHHIKLQYFRQEDNSSSPNTVLKSENYLDSAFGGVHIPALNITTAFQHLKNNKYFFINGGSFSYVADNGIYQDDSLILFYADNIYPLISSGSVFPKVDINKVSYNPIVSSPLFRQDLLFNKWQITEGTTSIDILEIVGYNKTVQRSTPTEDLLFLGLTKGELNTLDNLTGVSNLHHKYLLFEEIFDSSGNPLKDSITNTVYKKFKLKIQGFDESGEVQIVEPTTGNEIYVYGSTYYMLCTKDFTAAANIDRILPDPGTFTEFQNYKHIQFDSNDPIVTTLFPTGEINIDDSGLTFLPRSPRTLKVDAGLNGEFFYPIDSPGSSDLSTRYAQFPLVVICHGNGQRYSDYRELAIHLSKNGFIVMSISALLYNSVNISPMYQITDIATSLVFSTSFPTNYFITFGGNLDTIYIYNNDPGTPINSNYAYEKLTVIKGIGDSSVTPNTFSISDEYLLSFEKGIDFDVILDSTGTPIELNFLVKIGEHDMSILGRSNMIYPHLQIIRKYFGDKGWGNKIENKIGLIGHSRGAEAVVRCATDIPNSTLIPRVDIMATPDPRTGPDFWKFVPIDLFDIKAVVSLAPTDSCKDKINQLNEDVPYYVLYGSMEGDVVGNPTGVVPNRTSGFSIYDRTINNTEKIMSFVYGATHNGFITNNQDYYTFLSQTGLPDTYIGELESVAIQKKISLAYMNAFMRLYLKDENIWKSIFYGDYIPKSTMSDKIYPQYQNLVTPPLSSSKWLVNFDTWGSPPYIKLNGVAVPASSIDDLINLNSLTPHDAKGIKISIPKSRISTLAFEVDTNGKDISSYDFLSFRIGHVVLGTSYADLSKIEINLSSLSASYKRILNKTIPVPHQRESMLTKSAMSTIRLSLSDFSSNGIDLTKIKSLELIFPSFPSDYEILMDDIEFTN